MTTSTPTTCDPQELRTLFLFEKLSDEQLNWLCGQGHVVWIDEGLVYREGDPATCFYVLLEGTVALLRNVSGDDVEVTRTSNRGVYAGAWRSFISDADGEQVQQTYEGSLRAVQRSRFFVLDAPVFTAMVRDWFPMAVHLLEGLFFGMRNSAQVISQRERLLALGSLSAGLTHELNNPAAAAVRATALLRERVAGMRRKLALIAAGTFDRSALTGLVQLQEDAAERVAKAPMLSPLEASDREDELAEWLEGQGIEGAWELAPNFVQAGLDIEWLTPVRDQVESPTFEGAIRWLNYTVETELLMNEIEDSTTRISTLVAAAKQYSQMDRAPYQVVDVHELLDSTLLMMSRKITPDITVDKGYDRGLPAVPAYAAELNQVWTNLIDNAVQAMPEGGTLTLRTTRDGDDLVVTVGDTGVGIPEEIQSRIFEPFFTTKPIGQGTGLGLDISWRIVVKKHHGDIRVTSQPGHTEFEVRLPLRPPQPDPSTHSPAEEVAL
jgi:signal transduction histidine kinase